MPKSKYPLESLRKLRATRVDESTEALARAVRVQDDAARGVVTTVQARTSHDRAATTKREAELEALEQGQLTAGDLARQRAWEFAVNAERVTLERAVVEAKVGETKATEGLTVAKTALVAKKAEVDVVEKDHGRFARGEAKRVVASEEEAAEDAWRPKRA